MRARRFGARIPADLARGRERFARWRQRRVLGERIPEALWDLAVKLARDYGLSRTATALKVGYYSLQERVAEAAHNNQERDDPSFRREAPQPVPSGFVELQPLPSSHTPGELGTLAPLCQVECENAAGQKLRISWHGSQPPGAMLADAVALVRELWGRS